MEKAITFSQQVKSELCTKEKKNYKPCCKTALCYGLTCFAKYFDEKGLVIHTDYKFIADYAQKVFDDIDLHGEITKRNSKGFEFAIKEPFEVEKLLAFFGRTGKETNMRIDQTIFTCEDCYAKFLIAAFLSVGTITNPQKEYALEFVIGKYNLSNDFVELLQSMGFIPRVNMRKGNYVIYFRASEQIEDLLVLMGANKAAFEMMNSKVLKEIRNNVNRVSNSETANIKKAVLAAEKHLQNIDFLESRNMLNHLPDDLLEIAMLRKKHPEYSLQELGELCAPPLSKAGVSHRLKKIENAALTLKERKNNA